MAESHEAKSVKTGSGRVRTTKTADKIATNAPARGPKTVDAVIPGPHTQAHEGGGNVLGAPTAIGGPASAAGTPVPGPIPAPTPVPGLPVPDGSHDPFRVTGGVDPLASTSGPQPGAVLPVDLQGNPKPAAQLPPAPVTKHKISEEKVGGIDAWRCTCGFRTMADEATAKAHADAANHK